MATKRKVLTLEDRMKVVKESESGKSVRAFAKQFMGTVKKLYLSCLLTITFEVRNGFLNGLFCLIQERFLKLMHLQKDVTSLPKYL